MQALKEEVGDNDAEMLKLVGSTEGLAAITSIAGPTADAYTSTLRDMEDASYGVNEAFEKQKQTVSAQLTIMKNKLDSAAISLGQVLLPYVIKLADFIQYSVIPALSSFGDWLGRNMTLVKLLGGAIIGVTVAWVAMNVVIAVSGAVMATVSAISVTLTAIMALQAQGLTIVQAAWFLLNTVMLANPIGLAIILVGGLIGAIALLTMTTNKQESAQSQANDKMQRAVDLVTELTDLENKLEDQRLRLEGSTLAVEAAEDRLNEVLETHNKTSYEARLAAHNLKVAQKNLADQDKENTETTTELNDKEKERIRLLDEVYKSLDKLDGKSVKFTIDGHQRIITKYEDEFGNPFTVETGEFARGGFTGRGGVNQMAGVVHKGEYVIPKQYVNQSTGLPSLQSLAKQGAFFKLFNADIPMFNTAGVGGDVSSASGSSGSIGDVFNIDSISLPNVEKASDFAEELKLKMSSMRSV